MACCKCCCGGVTCEEGQAGKCCCGGAEGVCCQTGERCCDGTCQAVACCPSSCDGENPCAEGCYCCGGTCQDEPCCDCVGECAEPGWICCDGLPLEATCCPTCDESNPCNDGCQCCNGECIPDEDTCCSGPCDETTPCGDGCQCCDGVCIPESEVCCAGPCDEYTPPPEGCVCRDGNGVPDPGPGCCCINGVADPGVLYPWDCEAAGGIWLENGATGGACTDDRCQYCVSPTAWRIIDGNDTVYSSGTIVDFVLYGLENPWTPAWRYGSSSMRLEINGPAGVWETLETWTFDFDPCVDSSYPSHTFSPPWPPPAPYDCAIVRQTDAATDPCVPCPELTTTADAPVPSYPGSNPNRPSPYRCGDGIPGSGGSPPVGGVGARFTAAVDGEWTNLLNWEDGDGVSPAGSLPGAWDTAIIAGSVTTSAAPIAVAELIIESTGGFSVVASATNLHCYGAIARNSACQGVFGQVTVSGYAFVYGGGANNGEIINASVKFSGNGLNDTDGVVTGGARFYDTARNDGAITGDAEFYDNTENHGTVDGDGLFDGPEAGFATPPQNFGTVKGDGVFRRNASNIGTVEGNAKFYDTSGNDVPGIVFGSAVFNDNARNDLALVQTNATFNDNSINAGTVSGNATFNGSSVNGESPNFGPGYFGSVTGTATFTGNACNDGGTAGTFVPNPPPSC